MKYIALLIIPLCLFGCEAFKKPIQPALANVNVSPEQDLNAIKGAIDGELNAVKGDVAAIKGDIKKLADLQAQIGANNSIDRTEAGRDINENNTNDSDLMAVIFKYWYGIFVLIIGFMKWNSMSQSRQYERQVRQLTVEKEDYKRRYLAVGINSMDELKAFRKEHDAIKKEAGYGNS